MKKRWWVILGLLVAGSVAFGIWFDHGGQGQIAIQTGTRCGSTGAQYCYWSGFGSVMPWVLLGAGGVIGVLVAHLRAINCHEQGCVRIGRFPIAGGSFRYCGKHHPDWQGNHPSRAHILHRHEDHAGQARLLDEIHRHVTALAPKAGNFPPPTGTGKASG